MRCRHCRSSPTMVPSSKAAPSRARKSEYGKGIVDLYRVTASSTFFLPNNKIGSLRKNANMHRQGQN